MTEQQSSAPRFEEIELLVQQLEATADQQTRDTATELVQLVMELHRTGLEQLLRIVTLQIAPHQEALLRLADDELVAGLLLLHGLHPIELSTRVNLALEKVRPYLKSHGGDVELIEIEDGVVRLRLQGSCHGCPSSAMTLKTAIEESIYRFAPDIGGLNVEGVVQSHSPGFIPVESLALPTRAESAAPSELAVSS